MSGEREVLAQVLLAVTRLPGAFLTRTNTGTARSESGRVIRFGRPGQPDISGCVRGRYVGIEVKTATGRQSKDQKNWQRRVQEAGGIYVLARSAADALAALAAIP